MKMFYGNTPVKSMKVHSFELNTNDATMIASDLQAGVTAYARGQKITGTGKSFEFAYYGDLTTNTMRYVPDNINVIEVASVDYPVKLKFILQSMKDIDFKINQNIGAIIVDGNEYDLTVSIQSNMLTVACDASVRLQVFYGKDNYI